VSKSDLLAPVKITVVGNSNPAETKKKEDVTELGVGTYRFLWQVGGNASGKQQE